MRYSKTVTIGKRIYNIQDPTQWTCIFCGGKGKVIRYVKRSKDMKFYNDIPDVPSSVEVECQGCKGRG